MKLEDRLAAALAKHKPIAKKMFGGTCFMLNGNMVIGTFKGGILARVGKDAREALKMPGAAPFEMRGREMEGYAMVAESAVASDAALARWSLPDIQQITAGKASEKCKKAHVTVSILGFKTR